MALLFMDGFDAYGVNQTDITEAIEAAGWVGSGFFGTLIQSLSDTRTGVGYSCNVADFHSGYAGEITRNFPTAASIVAGFAVKITDPSAGNGICAIGFNNYLGSVVTQISLFYNGANGVTAQTGDSANSWASAPNVLFENVWQYMEVKYTPGLGSGSIEVKIDGVVVISESSVSSSHAGTPASVNFFSFTSSGQTLLVDDFYLCDQTGSSFNNYLGDCVVHAILPNADTGTNQWTQTGGGSGHFSSIDDNPPNFGASYLSSNTSGQMELFTLPTLPSDIVDVLAVGINILATKTAPGLGTYEAVCVVGGVEQDSPAFSAPIAYVQTQYLMTSPPGGGTWTLSAAQNAEYGVKIP